MKRLNYFPLTATLSFLALVLLIAGCNGNQEKAQTSASDTDQVSRTDTAKANDVSGNPWKRAKICTELLPPPPPTSAISSITETFYNFDFDRVDTLKATVVQPTRGYLALLKAYRWRKDTIHVIFLDGSPKIHQTIAAVVRQWEQVGRIIFDFTANYPNPDITISFLYAGSWSQIGTYSRKVRPSMNFGWLDEDSSPEEYSRVVLHEFGHALGFIHEQSQPEANIPWDTAAVYKYYSVSPNFWNEKQVNDNIFFKYSRAQINGTQYDPKSIMHYFVPPELTSGRFQVDKNNELSLLDKAFAAECYPKKAR